MLQYSILLKEKSKSQPILLLGSSWGATGKENHNGAGYKQGEDHESNDGDGEVNGVEGNGVEDYGGEGNGSEGEGSGGESDPLSSNKLSKLHRPTWVKELFFSLQASQKLSIKDTYGWVMENMSSVFCPNGKPLTLSAVCPWKKQLEKKETTKLLMLLERRSVV